MQGRFRSAWQEAVDFCRQQQPQQGAAVPLNPDQQHGEADPSSRAAFAAQQPQPPAQQLIPPGGFMRLLMGSQDSQPAASQPQPATSQPAATGPSAGTWELQVPNQYPTHKSELCLEYGMCPAALQQVDVGVYVLLHGFQATALA